MSTNPKNSLHRRNNSGELDVFEAAGYFSAANETSSSAGENRAHGQRAARMSLDMPIPIGMDGFPTKENRKYKQPSSPGGRLASFLNSLFSQTASKKKKKSKPKPDNLDREQEESRKRRSSISHFRGAGGDSAMPPAKTPTKSAYGEFRSFSDHQKTEDEEFRFSNGNGFEKYEVEAKLFRKFEVVDDEGDSDSSSDLFDLPNYDLDLPVYGTTKMDRIRVHAAV